MRRRRRMANPTKIQKRRPDEERPFSMIMSDLMLIHLSQADVLALLDFTYEHYEGEHRYWNRKARDDKKQMY